MSEVRSPLNVAQEIFNNILANEEMTFQNKFLVELKKLVQDKRREIIKVNASINENIGKHMNDLDNQLSGITDVPFESAISTVVGPKEDMPVGYQQKHHSLSDYETATRTIGPGSVQTTVMLNGTDHDSNS